MDESFFDIVLDCSVDCVRFLSPTEAIVKFNDDSIAAISKSNVSGKWSFHSQNEIPGYSHACGYHD